MGRVKWDKKIPAGFKNTTNAWFHFASLGEFEQGKPLLEKYIFRFPTHKIVLTFFSPSGYEIRKNYPLAHLVLYLPLDTQANAKKFIDLINPEIVFVTKYEYWYHFFREIKKRAVPLYMVSAIFRPQQVYFKFYGAFNRKILACVSHFFVQNQVSLSLLKSIGLNNVTCVGDTRFDTVSNTINHTTSFDLVRDFCAHHPVLIAGSTWYKDEILLAQLLKTYPNWKLIIAPHEIGKGRITLLKNIFLDSITYTSMATLASPKQFLQKAQILIIDTMGMLSSLYNYGQVAYIGGGFGAGIHNTLEAAAFGLPILFGPKNQKYAEAVDLIKIRSAFSVANQAELDAAFLKLSSDSKFRQDAGSKAKVYVQRHIGASQKIIDFVGLGNKLH